MVNRIKGISYEEYLNNAKQEEMIFINEFEERGKLINRGLEKVKNIRNDIRVLVITSTMCKDSATIVPILNRLASLNDKIKVEFLLKNENEQLLEELTEERKVPSIIILDSNGNVIRKFVEFPIGVKNILISNPKENTQKIIDHMRCGSYNNLIQEDLIRFLTGENYKFISFKREDK